MTTLLRSLLGAALCAGWLGAAGAVDTGDGTMRATRLLGAAVVNSAGASLGRIEGVLLDTRARGQHYALLERAEGGADKRFVYPVNALRRGSAHAVVLHVPERNLELSQGTQDGAWPSPEARSGERYIRVREVIGKPVFDELGNRVGVLHDLEVSLYTARTRSVLVDFADGGILPLPAHAVHLSPEGRITLQPDSQRRS